MFAALVFGAALSFSVGGLFMKLSNGLTEAVPTTLVFACFSVGAALQTLAMRNETMSVTYVVVLGFEAITAYLLGAVLLREPTTTFKIAGIGLVVAGIATLKLGRD